MASLLLYLSIVMKFKAKLRERKRLYQYFEKQFRYSFSDQAVWFLVTSCRRYLVYLQDLSNHYPDEILKKFHSWEDYCQFIICGQVALDLLQKSQGVVLTVTSVDEYYEYHNGDALASEIIQKLYRRWLLSSSLQRLSAGQIEFCKNSFRWELSNFISDMEYPDSPDAIFYYFTSEYEYQQLRGELEFLQDSICSARDILIKFNASK